MAAGGRKAVFLDRDGVLNRCYERGNVSHPPASVQALEILPGVKSSTQRLCAAGFVLIVVTNQPDVARGAQARETVEAINSRLRAEIPLHDVRVCYHDSADGCACRKPKPGMLLKAAADWVIDLSQSFMVGDRWSDVVAGQAAGCRSVLVQTDRGSLNQCSPDRRVRDLSEATEWILKLTGEYNEAFCGHGESQRT
jgi:D-glycero-D-manno-heptose 1,7-bisphosphate phosphatase